MSTKVFPIIDESVESAIDPNNKLTFLMDWELTLKCNLDCSYCGPGHDNSTNHPPLEDCLKTIDFMYQYVDLYMQHKSTWSRRAVLNVYGGESLYHPDIITILSEVKNRHKKFEDRWSLTVTTTTNAVVSENQMKKIVNLVDEFTVSYHTESTKKQQDLVRTNLLLIKNSNKKVKCVIVMNPREEKFTDNLKMIDFCTINSIKYLPRQIDHLPEDTQWNYKPHQVQWFNNFYQKKTFSATHASLPNDQPELNLTSIGRACCSGRQLAINQNYSERIFYSNARFPNWYCSVNWFFVFVKQVTKEVFVNKDCQMTFDGTIGPIGYLTDTESLLKNLKSQLSNNTLPTIQCKKFLGCLCGLCAPKAKDLSVYKKITEKYKL